MLARLRTMLSHLWAMLAHLGAMWAQLAAMLAPLGPAWGHLLRAMLAHLGARFGAYVGPCWPILIHKIEKMGKPQNTVNAVCL